MHNVDAIFFDSSTRNRDTNSAMKTHATTTTMLMLTFAACGGGGGGSHGDDDGGPIDAPSSHADGNNTVHHDAPTTSPTTVKVFTIILENHDYAEIVGSPNTPYINNTLIANGALATNYKDTAHPSLPNYLHLITGASSFNGYTGVIDVDPTQFPYFPDAMDNLGTQLQAANIKWRSYQESMGTACSLTANSAGTFAPKHDPFLYFTDMQTGTPGLCAQQNVDYSNFAADLASNEYRYMWITPNLTDDGHDPATDPVAAIKQTDTWLSTEVPKILASNAYQHGGILFITWDEAEGRAGDDPDKIPMIVMSKNIVHAGMTSANAYTHSSYLATVEDLLGLPRLTNVATSPNMMEFLVH